MNARTFNIVVLILGGTIGLCLGGIIYLAGNELNTPQILETVVVAALAGMTGLLARSPGAEEPSPVRVVNAPLSVTEDETPRPTRQMHSRRLPSPEEYPRPADDGH